MSKQFINGIRIRHWAMIASLAGFCFLTMPVNAQNAAPEKTSITNIDSDAVENLFFSALKEKTVDNNAGAADIFNKILVLDPQNDAALYELANIKKKENKFTEAQPLLEKAVTIKPDNEWYWSSLADIYEKANQIDKLENVFTQLIRLNPDKVDYYYDQGNAYFIQGRYDEALKLYDQVEQITGPNDDLIIARQKIYLKEGKLDKAAVGLEQMIASNPNQIKYYLLLAEIYTSNNATDKAFKVLSQAKAIEPNNPMIHLGLADIYRSKKDINSSFAELKIAFANPDLNIDQKVRIMMGYFPKFSEPNAKNGALASALELSKIIVDTHPNEAKGYALYGDLLVQSEKYPEAKDAYSKSVALNGQIYETREQLVRLELGSNDIEGVIRDGESALSFFPNQGWMNYYVGSAWLQKKDYQKALSYLKSAVAVEFQDKDLLSLTFSQMGDCYHAMQDNKNSDDSYEKSLSYSPDNKYTLNNYAYYLSLRGEQLDKAAAMAKHANELEVNNASFEDTYAWILFKQKNYKDAKVWMEKAQTDNKNKSAVQTEHYGDILFYLGDADGAVQYWKKAKEYGATSPVLDRKINEKKYIE
ncbi:tetratricopeptide repeat protein [Mucilaginibacter sp. dw_454]|uniref:tetratricopeptide repeat protein n=1 Tax=Mucilaginibacter sp. dw_454 TaxID=2720079 RepID=UPI001BD33C78|nr:tetratricopeptide repeat protein [Mucilaginibacter sp. dw_454]